MMPIISVIVSLLWMLSSPVWGASTAIQSITDVALNYSLTGISSYDVFVDQKVNSIDAAKQILASLITPTSPPSGTGANYYVDCTAGNDSANGTSTSTPWKSLSKASAAALNPGDSLNFKAGTTCTGKLTVTRSGTNGNSIYIQSYGTGSAPIISNPAAAGEHSNDSLISQRIAIQIDASYIVVRNIRVDNTGKHGIWLHSGGYNTLQNNEISKAGLAITIGDFTTSSSNNKIIKNYIHDGITTINTCGNDDDYGANGVNLWSGSNNEIAYNNLSRLEDASCDYGKDGGGIEFYTTGTVSNNMIHHNYIEYSNSLTEAGGNSGSMTNNYFYYNVSNKNGVNSPIMWFHNGGTFGTTIRGLKFYNNLFIENSGAYMGMNGSFATPSDFEFKNNIFYIDGFSLPGGASKSYNIYKSGGGGGTGEQVGDPGISNISSVSSTVWPVLSSGSRAINAGTSVSSIIGSTTDYRGLTNTGVTVPQGSTVDIGPYEY